jgi:signal peptidase I
MSASAPATALAPSFARVLRRHRAWAMVRWVGTVLVAVTLLRVFVGEASVVPTGSMERTILVGDHIFVDKALYGPEIPMTSLRLPALRSVRRGDIVAFRYPKDPSLIFLKRVIALGGDRVEIRNDVLFLNGQPRAEAYVEHTRAGTPGYRESMRPLVVPAGHMFVLGDNRDDSEDSRYFGAVPLANVMGEPVFIYWSYNAPSAEWLDEALSHRLGFYISMLPHLWSRTRWHRVGELL